MAAFVAPLISGLAGFFGGGKQQQVKSSSQQQQHQSQEQNLGGTNSSTVTPNLSPYQTQLADLFTGGAQDLYKSSLNLQPYTTGGLQQIQKQGGANNQIIANTLASRGQSFSPSASTALAGNTVNTGNQMNQFLQTVPLLQRQLQTQGLQGLLSAFGALPTGVTTQGDFSQAGSSSSDASGSSSGVNTQTGNPLAGLFSGFGAGLLAPGGSGTGSGNSLSQILKIFGI